MGINWISKLKKNYTLDFVCSGLVGNAGGASGLVCWSVGCSGLVGNRSSLRALSGVCGVDDGLLYVAITKACLIMYLYTYLLF